MKDKILIATGNKHKREKLQWIVSDLFEKVEFPENVGITTTVEEDAITFEENASKKAVEFSKQYDGYVIATDAGVSIPGLGDTWNGLYTKRFAGGDVKDQERIEKLLEMMIGLRGNSRKMVWNEAIAIAKNGRLLFSTQVEGVEGIASESYDMTKYKEGIWVCTIWYFPQWNKNFFDLTSDEVKQAEISWDKLYTAVRTFLS